MKIQYKLKDSDVIYNIENARAAYAVDAGIIRLFFRDKDGAPHDVKLDRKNVEYIFCDREKRDKYITPNGSYIDFKDLINAARRCRYDVKKCANCPFYSADNPNCYIEFMNAIIYLCGGNLING